MEHAVGETGRAIDGVRIRMNRGQTGKLRVHIPARGECAVYLMDGEIIGALTERDAACVLDRLVARGRVPQTKAAELKESAPSSMLGFEQLHRAIDPALVGRLMAGRFRDNLIFYLFDGGRFVFEPMTSIRVPHLQMGHDSASLLRELEVVYERIHLWMGVERRRTIGLGEHLPGSPQQRHIQALCSNGIRLDRLVHNSPFFAAQTLILVSQMVDSGCLQAVEIDPEDGPEMGAVSHAIEMAKAQKERRADAITTRVNSPSNGPISSDLQAFTDHEKEDRGMGKGEFRGDRDRVDLSEAPKERTPGLRLSTPQLKSAEVVRRVGVCNEVLTAFVDAWSQQYSPTDARHVAQNLIDGSPMDSAALFRGAMVDAKGRMGVAEILKNLERRPEGERRDLVTKGLTALIDRILARAVEGLSEDKLNHMLTQIAGYRQRMGW